MNVQEIFKYSSLISVPLFSVVALLITRNVQEYSFNKHTISKSILFLTHPTKVVIFRLNFLLKAILDLSFALFVINHFKISIWSFTSLMLISSAVLFGTLAYFVEGKHSISHKIITYTSGVLWMLGELAVVRLIGDGVFTIITTILLSIPIVLAFGFLFAKKTNVVVQAICMFIWYIWLLIFVFRYL